MKIRGNQEHVDFIGSGIEPLGFMSIVESTTVIFQQQPGVTPIEDGQGAFVIGCSVCGQRPPFKSKNRFIEVRDRALVVTKPDLHGPSDAVAEARQYGILAEGINSQTERFVVSPYDPVEVGKCTLIVTRLRLFLSTSEVFKSLLVVGDRKISDNRSAGKPNPPNIVPSARRPSREQALLHRPSTVPVWAVVMVTSIISRNSERKPFQTVKPD